MRQLRDAGLTAPNAFAALGYEAVYLLADAITRAGSTDRAALQAALDTTTDVSAVTGAITFTAEAHVPRKAVTLVAVRDGAFTLADTVRPGEVPAPQGCAAGSRSAGSAAVKPAT